MEIIGFVGASGTGKSYRSVMLAQRVQADAMIDDGLLISKNKVIAGRSGKREATRLASVRCALFVDKTHCREVADAIKAHQLERILILGTSEAMVERIANQLELGKVASFIHIEEVATAEEIALANRMRTEEGKHVIPVPVFEIKKDFSGYFLHPWERLKNSFAKGTVDESERSIVRPSFSYMGEYTISDNVIRAIAGYEAMRSPETYKVNRVEVRPSAHGVHLDVAVTLVYGCDIIRVARKIQTAIQKGIEENTSVNARKIHIAIKKLYIPELDASHNG